MSEHRILLIENPAVVSINLGRLCIRRHGYPDSLILPRDIAVLCLHHHTIQITVHALRALSCAGASVILTDEIHHPCAWLLPIAGHVQVVRRLHQQIALNASSQKADLWQVLVQSRLLTQATNLRTLGRNGMLKLERLAKEGKRPTTPPSQLVGLYVSG